MTGMRKRHSREVKLKVVCEALAGSKSIAQIASDHGVHPTQIKEWKTQALEAMGERSPCVVARRQRRRKSGYMKKSGG